MRGYRPERWWERAPATATIIAVCVFLFAVETFFGPVLKQAVQSAFGMSLDGLLSGEIWQMFTHEFLHGNLLHLAVNMVALWFAGRDVEPLLGTPRFLVLFFFGGVLGGLLQSLFGAGGDLIGASGSVFAVMIAFTTIFPDTEIMALLFFVIPIRMRAKYLAYAIVLFTLLFWASGLEPGIGHLAHLGGCLGGYLFARFSGYGVQTPPERWLRHLLAGR